MPKEKVATGDVKMEEAETAPVEAPVETLESEVVAKALREAGFPSSNVLSLVAQKKEEDNPGTTLVVEGELLA
eukprot:948846-Lingulodinium_polyedra.AAC.1